jgi:hypothetical protein
VSKVNFAKSNTDAIVLRAGHLEARGSSESIRDSLEATAELAQHGEAIGAPPTLCRLQFCEAEKTTRSPGRRSSAKSCASLTLRARSGQHRAVFFASGKRCEEVACGHI